MRNLIRISASVLIFFVLVSQVLPAQRLENHPALPRLKVYAESRRKLVETQVKDADKAWRTLGKHPAEVQMELKPIVTERLVLAQSQDILLRQLISLGKGEPEWKAGPFVPLSIGSLTDSAVGLKAEELRINDARTVIAGKLVYAKYHSDAAVERAIREEELSEYQLLMDVIRSSEETLDRVLSETGQPPVADLYERQISALARADAQRKAAVSEKQRRLEIGTGLWLGLGALWFTGQAVAEGTVSKAIAEFKEQCEKAGGRVFDGPDPGASNQRLIECR